jgi:transposase
LKKGHKDFVVIVTARDCDKITILAVLNDRKKSTVKAFLSSIPGAVQFSSDGIE